MIGAMTVTTATATAATTTTTAAAAAAAVKQLHTIFAFEIMITNDTTIKSLD